MNCSFLSQYSVQRAYSYRPSVWAIFIGRCISIHTLVGLYSSGCAVIFICPCVESTTIKRGHIELCLAMNHPLRQILTNTTLSNTNTCTTKIPKVLQSFRRSNEKIIIGCVSNEAIDYCANSYLLEERKNIHTPL